MAARKLYEGMVYFRTIGGRVVVFPGPDPARTGGTRWAKTRPSSTSPGGVTLVGKTKPVPKTASKPAPGTKPAVKSLQSARVRAGQWKAKGGAAVAAAFKKPVATPKPKPAPKPAPTPKPSTVAPKAVKPPPAPKPVPEAKPKPEPKAKPEAKLAPAPEAKAGPKSAPQPKVAKGAIDPKWQEPGNFVSGYVDKDIEAYAKDRGYAKVDAIQKGVNAIQSKSQAKIDALDQRRKNIENRYFEEGYKMSQKEKDAAYKDVETISKQIISERKKMNNATLAHVKSVLAVKNPTKIELDVSKDVDPVVSDHSKQAADFLGSILHDYSGSAQKFKVSGFLTDGGKGRAFYHRHTNSITMSKTDTVASHVHEMGHWLETKVTDRSGYNGVYESAYEFLKMRTKGEQAVTMNEYMKTSVYNASEAGKPDKFNEVFGKRAVYVGKIYKQDATEIISMGVEELYRNPTNFVKDKQYASFIFGILDGSLR